MDAQIRQISATVWGVTVESAGEVEVHLAAGAGPDDALRVFQDAMTPREASSAEALATRRAGMMCSRLQGRLTLGPEICARIDALADLSNGLLDALTGDPAASWAMRETILNAATWHRTSQTIDELAYVLDLSANEMDALFETAMQVVV